jgi:hypothetical protein
MIVLDWSTGSCERVAVMKNIESPINIEFLLHCHVFSEEFPRINAPAVQNAINKFLMLGVIESRDDEHGETYKTTDLGAAWVTALCNVPMPTKRYVDEQGRVL